MTKIIIHSHLAKYEEAVYFAYRCLNTSRWFNKTPDILLSFTKISKAEAKYLGYKFDK